MDFGNLTSNDLIYLLAFIAVFLICRELSCWYFKINKTIAVLEEIRELLRDFQQVAKVENKIEPNIGDINEV